jgi:sugar phosphate isomerase/epimerase
MKEPKFSAGVWAFTSCVDRFCVNGYRDDPTLEEKIAMAGRTEGLDGLILQYPAVVNDDNVDRVASLMRDEGVEVAAVDVSIFGTEFRQGAYTNPDPDLRRRAIDVTKRCADVARELGTPNVGIWPGQDGYDYLFQYDYREIWAREIDAIREVAEHAPDAQICVEYKIREPRMHMTVATACKALHLFNKIGLPNVGATVDMGHCFMARENPAESAALLHEEGRLFSAHFNDTYGIDDDDLIAGSVHLMHTIELLLVLDELGYEGWYGLDYFPYREDIVEAAEISIANVKGLLGWARSIDRAHLAELQQADSAIGPQRYLHELLFAAREAVS